MSKRLLKVRSFLLTASCLTVLTFSYAQDKADTTKEKSITGKAWLIGIGLISTNAKDTIANELSTDPFKIYENKIIRKINVEFIGLDRSIYDTAKRTNRIVNSVVNVLHHNTREVIIRNHLFIHKNKPLNPYRLADNERFIRDLDFILDARIVVTPVEGTDSVDLTTITRDIFSLGATAGGSANAPKFSVYDANLGGLGQRVQYTGLFDPSRSPSYGSSIYYRKSSWLGSLTNIEFGYTQLNSGRSYGLENEYAYFARIDRPLVSPYTRLAGGFEASNNWSVNVDKKSDSVFLEYKYKVFDTWLGYNIGIKNSFGNRNRYFLAVRYMDGAFVESPAQQLYRESRDYNSMKGVLSEFTFYRKNFFKTRYIFGFGRTEDVPYGKSISATAGYIQQLQYVRPYAALKYNYGQVSKKGYFYLFDVEAGSYMRNNKLEDEILTTQASFYTRLFNLNRYRNRNLFVAGYSQLLNRTADNYLKISKNEIHGFSADSLQGTQQFYSRFETVIYTPWSLAGFRFAPFAGLDWTQMKCVYCQSHSNRPNIFGINAGLRTRNENLIFGTVELRIVYLPDNGKGDSQFKFYIKQNLRVKNTGTFIAPPKLVTN